MPISSPSLEVDGRRLRSEASRRKIVEAMIALVAEGHQLPSAETVAARAGVGLRTVFRLFEDMDGVYRGMQVVIGERIGGLLEDSLPADDWPRSLDLIIDRRAVAFETMLPLQVAADAQRWRSKALTEGRVRLVQTQRDMVIAILPPAVRADADLVDALDLTLSFETWRRLRLDQRRDIGGAKAVMRRMALALTAGR